MSGSESPIKEQIDVREDTLHQYPNANRLTRDTVLYHKDIFARIIP